jgi:hypothetical protein
MTGFEPAYSEEWDGLNIQCIPFHHISFLLLFKIGDDLGLLPHFD